MASIVVKRPWPTRSTVHVTKQLSISLNLSTKKRGKQKNNHLSSTPIVAEIEMVSIVVKRLWPTRSSVDVTTEIFMIMHLSTQTIGETREKNSFKHF